MLTHVVGSGSLGRRLLIHSPIIAPLENAAVATTSITPQYPSTPRCSAAPNAAVSASVTPESRTQVICPRFSGVEFLESFSSKEDSDAPQVPTRDPSPGRRARPFR